VITNTLVGGWLGVAIPAAFEADDPAPYGVGLIAGPGLGLLGSLMYTKSYPITSGQTAAYRWSFLWLSWQGFLVRELTGIGTQEYCTPDGVGGEYCYDETSAAHGSARSSWAAQPASGPDSRCHASTCRRATSPSCRTPPPGDRLQGGVLGPLAPDGDPTDDALFGWMAAVTAASWSGPFRWRERGGVRGPGAPDHDLPGLRVAWWASGSI
jgi:hypothetical protein